PDYVARLKDDNPTVRKDAAEGIRLLKLRGDEAVPAIAPLIANFADVKGQMSDAKLKEEAKKAREYAAEAFCWMQSESAVAPLSEASRSKDPNVRAMAFYALGSLPIEIKLVKPKEILEAQCAGLKDDDANARYYVAFAWDKSLCIMNEDCVPPILDALNVEQTQFQCFLLRALSHLGPKAKAGIPVFEKLSKHSNREVASVAKWALLQASLP